MAMQFWLGLAALVALVPAVLVTLRAEARRDPLFWLLLATALVAALARASAVLTPQWHTGLADALWLTIAASLALFMLLSALVRDAWRLTALLLPYLGLLGVLAIIWQQAPERPLVAAPAVWLDLHILVSLATYGLLTIAAMAGLAVLLQERALKRKHRSSLGQLLPAIASCERLQVSLLIVSEIVLGLGLLTGMATEYFVSGRVLSLDHKTLFSILAFAVIAAMLAVYATNGIGGRRVARVVLLAYLLLTLAYPGVKFVTDVLLA